MKTYVLTISRAKDRQKKIKEHLDFLNIPFEFFIGIDAATERHPYFDLCRERLALWSTGRRFPNTKKACFVGHWLLWEKCIQLNEPILVLEDDAVILIPDLLELISQCEDVLKINGYLKLSGKNRHIQKTKYTELRILEHNLCKKLVWWHQGICLMSAYVMTPEGAKKLMPKKNKGYYLHTDLYLEAVWIHEVEQITPYPLPVTTNAETSFIEVEKGEAIRKISIDYLIRKGIKFYFQLRRWGHYLKFRFKIKNKF